MTWYEELIKQQAAALIEANKRIKTLEDAIRSARYQLDGLKVSQILEEALAAKEPKC